MHDKNGTNGCVHVHKWIIETNATNKILPNGARKQMLVSDDDGATVIRNIKDIFLGCMDLCGAVLCQ